LCKYTIHIPSKSYSTVFSQCNTIFFSFHLLFGDACTTSSFELYNIWKKKIRENDEREGSRREKDEVVIERKIGWVLTRIYL